MKIAITNPTLWPYVRRGTERFVDEFGTYLASRGHEVTVISSKPGRKDVMRIHGYNAVCHRRLWHPAIRRFGVYELHPFFFTLLSHLLRVQFDLVVCCTNFDTHAAILARKVTRTPCVFWFNTLPTPVSYTRAISLGGITSRRAVGGADEVIAISTYMQEALGNRFGRTAVRIPIPVDLARFSLSTERDLQSPVILCASALDDPRKGGTLLMRSFDRLKSVLPQARLQVAYPVDAQCQESLLQQISAQWRKDVEFLGKAENLPVLLGKAAVSVLPSLWESYGMVINESLSTGTPVVGTRSGAIPELIEHDTVGRLFDPGPIDHVAPTNVEGLAQALIDGIGLSRDTETANRCRAYAGRLGWEKIGPQFETLFEKLVRQRLERS